MKALRLTSAAERADMPRPPLEEWTWLDKTCATKPTD